MLDILNFVQFNRNIGYDRLIHADVCIPNKKGYTQNLEILSDTHQLNCLIRHVDVFVC